MIITNMKVGLNIYNMNQKQTKMLHLLDKQIQQCTRCDLHENGGCKPYWTEQSKYIILGEAPGRNEVTSNEPFIGSAGKNLWSIMAEFGLTKEDFLIINSVNCRPVNGNKNGKPTKEQMLTCRPWIRKYIKVLHPELILVLGSYPLLTLTGLKGIMSLNGEVIHSAEFDVDTVMSIHPAMCIYKGEEGKQMLRESIKVFKEKCYG